MRTTLTIDDDVAAKLREHMAETGKSFKNSVNELLRLGLHAGRKLAQQPFVVKPTNARLRPGLSLDKIEDLLDQVEGPDRKW